MYTFDAKFYRRNAVLDEHPWYLIPGKWMARAHNDDYNFTPRIDDDEFSPALLHSCSHSPYGGSGNNGQFFPVTIDHDYMCKDCKMRPSDKMLTLLTLLK